MEFKRRLPWSLRSVGNRKFGGGVWTEADSVKSAWEQARIAVKTPKRQPCLCCSHQRELYGPPLSDIRRLWPDVAAGLRDYEDEKADIDAHHDAIDASEWM